MPAKKTTTKRKTVIKKKAPAKRKTAVKKRRTKNPPPGIERKTGRPTNYRVEYDGMATRLARLGATEQEMADFFDVDVSGLHRWKKRYSSFSSAIKLGKDESDALVVQSLFRRAVGYECIDTKFATAEGMVTDAREYVKRHPPDTVACIYWLKNRRPDLWRDKVGVEHTGKDGGPIQTESTMTPEERKATSEWAASIRAELLKGNTDDPGHRQPDPVRS